MRAEDQGHAYGYSISVAPGLKGSPVSVQHHFSLPTMLFQGEQSPVVFEIRTDSTRGIGNYFVGSMDPQYRGLEAKGGKSNFQTVRFIKEGFRNSFLL